MDPNQLISAAPYILTGAVIALLILAQRIMRSGARVPAPVRVRVDHKSNRR